MLFFISILDSDGPRLSPMLSMAFHLVCISKSNSKSSPILSDISKAQDSISSLLTGPLIWLAGIFDQEKSGDDPALPAIHFHFNPLKRPLRESNPQLELRRALWFCQSLSRTDMFSLLLSRTFFIFESNSGNLNTLSVKTR